MRILLDLIPLKSGGGLQVGLGLIEEIERNEGFGHEWHALVTERSSISDRIGRCRSIELFESVPSSLQGRLWFERRHLPNVLRRLSPTVVYSQFGPGLPVDSVPSVVGSAYSNLYYPEIDFWGNWPLAKRTMFRLRDRFRLSRTLRADGWIFESDALAERSKRLFGLPDDRVAVVRPSASPYITRDYAHPAVATRCTTLPEGFRVLMLSGWHMNKGMELVPEIAHALKQDFGAEDFIFVLTVPPDHPRSRDLLRRADEFGVEQAIHFFGPVPQDGCAEVYRATDCTLLLSLLESFSNNIIESWTMDRPLVVSDAEWSRSLCGDAALYTPRTNPRDIAHALISLRDSGFYDSLCARGRSMRETYPSLSEKVGQYLEFVEQIAAMGPR